MGTNPDGGKQHDLPKRRLEDILPLTFFVMKCCGVWQPFDSVSFLKVGYTIYMIFAMFLMVTVTLSLLCVTLFSSENVKKSVVENSFLLLTLFNSWVKAIVFLTRRKDIESLLHMLLQNNCQPLDSVEVKIQRDFDKEARQVTRNYAILVTSAVTIMYFPIVLEHGEERIKILNVWRPYDLKVNLFFWITYVHEVLGHFVIAYVHLSADILIPGLLMQLSCQIKILCHRLSKLSDLEENFHTSVNDSVNKKPDSEKSIISVIITHHNILNLLTTKINRIFAEVLFFQFCLSLFVICFSMFKILSTDKLDSNTIIVSIYTCCMLTQLFVFCWYGNELMLNSTNLTDAILETNWPFLQESSKQSLIIIMIRCTKPFIISTGLLIFVNLNTFTSILKASYSAYNVLQHSM